MSQAFDGRVALVTAAAGAGIGQAVARRLAAGGASVVVTDMHERRTKEVAEAIAHDYPDVQVAYAALGQLQRQSRREGARPRRP
jgi:NAD(P)-dependent dehydrogenase (short-subunit alcohol dehydrogenase family)